MNQCHESEPERQLLDETVRELEKREELTPEKWRHLSNRAKEWVLEAVGKELMKVYRTPKPPLLVEDMGSKNSLGSYEDVYYGQQLTGKAQKGDWWIRLNKGGVNEHKRLFGDDSAEALRVYAHEFRHSYQHEQAFIYHDGRFVHWLNDPEQASRWLDNITHYRRPPDEQDSDDPKTREKTFMAYWTQPVEEDARRFADELVRRIYGQSTGRLAGGDLVSNKELHDIEREAEEQQEQAEKMEDEIEQHKDRVEKLEQTVREIRASGQELHSEEIKHAEVAAEKAKAETERQLREIRERRDTLLQDNRQMSEKVRKAYEGRSRAYDKVGILENISREAPGQIRGQIETVRDSLHLDMNRLGQADGVLAQVRKRLEALDI